MTISARRGICPQCGHNHDLFLIPASHTPDVQAVNCLNCPALGSLQAEVTHWKANHADMVQRNAVLMDRPDLKERSKLVMELQAKLAQAEKDAARYRWLRDEDNWGDDVEGLWAELGELSHGFFDSFIDARRVSHE